MRKNVVLEIEEERLRRVLAASDKKAFGWALQVCRENGRCDIACFHIQRSRKPTIISRFYIRLGTSSTSLIASPFSAISRKASADSEARTVNRAVPSTDGGTSQHGRRLYGAFYNGTFRCIAPIGLRTGTQEMS